jgi:hypothetical protein
MADEPNMQGVFATTHVDRHGDRFTKEALEQMVEDFRSSNRPNWIYWNHETTLPPIGHLGDQQVELREDGEYQIVGDSTLFSGQWSEEAGHDNINGLNITIQEIDNILAPIVLDKEGRLVVTYDTINYSSDSIRPIIESLNEVVPTEEQVMRRKAEIPHEVIWVLVAFAGGIVARYGERAADIIAEKAIQFYKELNSRFVKILELKPDIHPDVIFSVPIPNTNTVVEAAIEEARKDDLEIAWRTLPQVYAIASHIIERCPPDHFADMKFLFNPQDNKWDINYFTVKATKKILLGPRYYQPDHPRYQRWERTIRAIEELNDE